MPSRRITDKWVDDHLGDIEKNLPFALLATAFTGESSATAKKNFCNSLDNLSSTVMNHEGLNPATATNDELDALTAAYDDLYWAIQDLPGDYTVAQDLDALQPELNAFQQAFNDTFDGSGCSSSAS